MIAFHQNLLVESKNSRCDSYFLRVSSCFKNLVQKSISYFMHIERDQLWARLLFTSCVNALCILEYREYYASIVFKCNVLATYTWLAIVPAPCALTIIARSMHSIESWDKVHSFAFLRKYFYFLIIFGNHKCIYAFMLNFSILSA